jgi:hypothetical protein
MFIYPRLCLGGIMVFDDYGAPLCPGARQARARQAIDKYFARTSIIPLVLQTGQAVIFKSFTLGQLRGLGRQRTGILHAETHY